MGKKRGSKKGVKRGPYTKRKPDQLGLFTKLATKDPRLYALKVMRQKRGTPPSRFGKLGRPPKRFLLKDFEKLKRRVTK